MGVLGFGRRYVRVSSCEEEETSVDVLIDGAKRSWRGATHEGIRSVWGRADDEMEAMIQYNTM